MIQVDRLRAKVHKQNSMAGEIGARKKWTDPPGGPIIEVDLTSGFTVQHSFKDCSPMPPASRFKKTVRTPELSDRPTREPILETPLVTPHDRLRYTSP